MNSRLARSLIAAACFLATAHLGGQEEPARVYLGGPEVTKLDWNTRALVKADFDGDQRLDLALINNDTAKIELLFQHEPGSQPKEQRRTLDRNRWEPILEDGRFVPGSFVTADIAYALAAGDLNGDGRVDLAYTADRQALTIRYQSAEGTWGERWEYDNVDVQQWVSTLRTGDLDADGRTDLAVLGSNRLLLFLQDEEGRLRAPREFALTGDNPHRLGLEDLNGDRRPDLAYVSGGGDETRLRVRFQQEGSRFGPELAFELGGSSEDLLALPGRANSPATIVTIGQRASLLEQFRLQLEQSPARSVRDLQARSYALNTRIGSRTLYTLGDFDGDGQADLVAGDSRGARVLYFRGQDNAFEEARSFPSLTNLDAVEAVDHDGDGNPSLFVLSRREGLLGRAEFTRRGRFSFPQTIAVEGEPRAFTGGSFRPGDGEDLLVVTEASGDYTLNFLRWSKDAASWMADTLPLPELKRDPDWIASHDFNGDRLPDLLIVLRRDPALLLLGRKDGSFDLAAQDSALRKSTLGSIDPARLGFADVDGERGTEILVASRGYVRALKISPTGRIDILDQFNARDPDTSLRVPLFVNFAGRGEARDLLLFASEANALEHYRPDEADVFRYVQTQPLSRLQVLGQTRLPDHDRGRAPLILFGEERFLMLPLESSRWKKEPLRTPYESDIDEIYYSALAAGNFNADREIDFVAVDGSNNFLEILTAEGEEGYRSLLHFVLFERNPHFTGRQGGRVEPREIVVGDFTDDGRDDIVLLVHDRILLYRQENAPAQTAIR